MPTTFTIAIDWDRKNNFTGAQDEVTARVQQVNWFLGMRQPWHDKADNSMLSLTLRIDPRIEIMFRPYRHRLHSHFDLRNGRQEWRPQQRLSRSII